MELFEFQDLKNKYKDMSVDDKIKIYTTTQGLTQSQYRELLKLFPINELNKLEMALSN